MQDKKERVNHHLPLLSNKDDVELAVVVAMLPVAEIKIENFLLSLAEQMNDRIFAIYFIGQIWLRRKSQQYIAKYSDMSAKLITSIITIPT